MRIVHLNTFHTSGGAAIAAGRLNRALRKTGVDSSILVSELSRPEEHVRAYADTGWQRRLAFLRFALDRLSFVPYERSREVRFAFSPARVGADIRRHPLVREADVLHLHWTQFGFLSLASLQQLFSLGKPVVWTMHDMWAFTGGCHHSGACENYRGECGNCEPFLRAPSPNDLSHRIWLRKAEAYAGARLTPVACSEWLAGRARRSGLFRNLPVQAIPNPLDSALFTPLDKAEARRTLNLPVDKRLILFAAAKVAAVGKGFSYFQQALDRLLEKLPRPEDVELLIFGAGDEELLRALPFRYHFLGRLSDAGQIVAAYSAADLFVIPSLEENLPNTIMESMACGTPVVGFEVGGIPEMIQHHRNGYLVRYRSVEDLAAGMHWVLRQSPGDYRQLGLNARQYVLQRYDEPLIARRYKAIYEHVLADKNS